jgi:acyl dehydratase
MSLDVANIGREFPPTTTYLVGREKIREFARAVGETSAASHDVKAARAAGYSDLIAPVTFPIIITLEMMGAQVTSPDVGVDWSRVVHGNQRFAFARPVIAGMELESTTVIEDIKSMAGNDIITLRGDLREFEGALVCQVWTSLVVRGDAA